MLQFEYDIRSHKVKALDGKSKQLAVGIAFVITAIVLYFFKSGVNRFDFIIYYTYCVHTV